MSADSGNESSPLIVKPNGAAPLATEPNAAVPPDYGTVTQDGDGAERQSTDQDAPKPVEGLPDVRKRMMYIFPALAVGIFLSSADQTIIAASYGRIGSELDALNKTSWIATAYFLTLTSFQPLYGKLSDIFSRKSCLMVGYTIFGIGCLFCGLARNIDDLIAARAFAGIGGGGMTTVVSIIFSDIIPLKDRGTWQGYINIIFATGASTGAPLGGILADSIGWRWAFIGQVPLCAIAMLAVFFALDLPPQPQSELDWKAKLRRLDFLGAALLISAVFTLLLGMDRGSNVSWTALEALIPLCVSFPLFGLFIFVELKVATEPFAPGHLIFQRSLFAGYLCNFFSMCGWMATMFYLPLYFQAVQGKTATEAGTLMIPGIVCSVCGSLFAGFVMKRTGKYYWLTVCAFSGLTVGLAGIVVSSGLGTEYAPLIVAGLMTCGFFGGIGITSSLIALISNVGREDQAIVTACSYLFRSLGSVTGISLSAGAANSTLRMLLEDELSSGKHAAKIVERVRKSLAYIKTLEPAVQEIVRGCYKASTRAAFGMQLGFVCGAAFAAWFIREKPLNR